MRLIKRLWIWGLRRVREEVDDAQDDITHSAKPIRWSMWLAACYFICALAVGIYWSFFPRSLDVKLVMQHALLEQHVSSAENVSAGIATTASLIAIAETLWEKPGGYLSNDMLPPSIWLDNMPYWEQGVLSQVRDTVEVLRASFSQSVDNSYIDDNLQKARARLNFSSTSWLFPAAESQYIAGVNHLKKYLHRLIKSKNTDAHFYADADHLNDYLAGVEQRLKNLSQRLTASVGPDINTDASALKITQIGAGGLYTKTPWLQIDNVFYEARGSSWALLILLQGVEIDFAVVLQEKNAKTCYEQIIRELLPTQQPIYSPFILNGDGFGFVANHSLLMASYFSRTQAAVADCRRQLSKF